MPKVKLKKFRKFKSDALWEKENANYESLDSEDSVDIQKKVNKTTYKRTPDMDRMDLTESNIKKKEFIQKELSKTYMKVETYGTNVKQYKTNNTDPNAKPQKDIKINLFEDSVIHKIEPVRLQKSPIRKKRKKKAPPVKFELKKARSVQNSTELEKNEFLPKVLSRGRGREAFSMDFKQKEENRERNLNTQTKMMDIKKRFETENEFEEFKFY